MSEPLDGARRDSIALANDIWRQQGHALDHFFKPRNIAVIGATEAPGSVGRTILWNLISSPFGGTVFPVNPKRASVMGIKAYPALADVPAPVDLAVIVTPAPTVPGIVQSCEEAGVPAVLIISAGFKELGPPGLELEAQVRAIAQRSRMRIIGPNCLGIMNPTSGVNATFAKGMARPGKLAFISQSGALLTAILDWSLREQVGFSGFVSTGSMLDVGWGDLIDYFGDDPNTKAILLYMESIGDARSFLSAAREVALNKPIIVIKAGRSDAAAKAAASHTGSLTGSDEVLDAAFRRSGVLRVNSIDELFNMAEILSKQPRPTGPGLTIVTNAGGPAVLATDALVAGGGELVKLAPETLSALDAVLPSAWSHGNPIDVLGDAGPERYVKALEIAAQDPSSNGLLVILTPQDMTDPTLTAAALQKYATLHGKPVLASWMGGASVAAGNDILNRSEIPTFDYPDSAARAFCYMWSYTYDLKGLYETPSLGEEANADAAAASELVERARQGSRTLLDEAESKRLLAAYGIPVVETRVAHEAEQAVAIARELGFPVVAKLFSRTITHKTDVGGVMLDLKTPEAVKAAFETIRAQVAKHAGAEHFQGVTVQRMVRMADAYELIVGSSVDPQFGPVLLFGVGGQLVEVFRDRALALPPLNATLARRLIEETRIAKALRGVRGRQPIDLEALGNVLVRFSRLIVEQPAVKELDINPLIASPSGIIALDARVVLHEPGVDAAHLPRPAIRPYPTQYVKPHRLSDGTEVLIRPIRPEDEPAIAEFHKELSERSVRLRYFQPLQLGQRTAHERLIRVCFGDYDRELALVVERKQEGGEAGQIIAVGRLSKTPGQTGAEFAILISDAWQRRGLGTELLRRLIQIGKDEKVSRISADILPDNADMRRVCEKCGFKLEYRPGDSVVRAVLPIDGR
ncbi:MAG: CoA-binding domain protein [Polyangiaceae bacterium]|jgi:acetyltransferase|nr:CoA-binding domain protein [Polyangiaceae bacterium]